MDKTAFISLEEATARLLARTPSPVGRELIALTDTPGRVLCGDITAELDQPPFHRSPLDGYALRSADLVAASPEHPVKLRVTARLFAGDSPAAVLGPGEAARIMTGAPIPPGADCVAAQEKTDGGEAWVQVPLSLRPHENFCFQGEDVKAGTPLFSKGTRLDWTHIAALAGQGIQQVVVYPRPRVAVLATGDELCPPGAPLPPGKIYDSNSPMLCARLASLSACPVPCPPGIDDPVCLTELLRTRLRDCDMVLTSGGVSVGQRDFMPRVADLLGAEVLFHGVAVRPGSPVLAMAAEGKLVIALSGNPFAAAAVFEALVRPALERLSGACGVFPARRGAVLRGEFPKASPMRRLVRGVLAGGEVLIRGRGHASGMVAGLGGCNCLVDIPAGSPGLRNGDRVEVLSF